MQYILEKSSRTREVYDVAQAWQRVGQVASQTLNQVSSARRGFAGIVSADKALSAMLGNSSPDVQELMDLEFEVIQAINTLEVKLEALKRLSDRKR
jgi:hypothetical protein